MSIALLTKATGTITAPDDGILSRALAKGKDCIISGCVLSIVNISKIKITAGYLLVCGRICKIAEESLTVSLASSGTQTRYLYVTLAPNGGTPVAFDSGALTLPGMTSMQTRAGPDKALLCVYTATTSAVSTISTKIFAPASFPKSYRFISMAGHDIANNDQSAVVFPLATIEYSGSGNGDDIFTSGGYAQGVTVPAGYCCATVRAWINWPPAAGDIRYVLLYRKRSGTDDLIDKGTILPVTGSAVTCGCGYAGPVAAGDQLYIIGFQDSGGTITFSSGGMLQMSITLN